MPQVKPRSWSRWRPRSESDVVPAFHVNPSLGLFAGLQRGAGDGDEFGRLPDTGAADPVAAESSQARRPRPAAGRDSSCHRPPLSGDCRNGWPVRGTAVAVMTACVSAGIVASARDLVGGMVVVIPMEATIAAIGSITSSKDSRVRALCRSASRQPSRSAARYRLQRAPRLGLAAWGIWAERPTVALARLLRAARAIMLPFPQG